MNNVKARSESRAGDSELEWKNSGTEALEHSGTEALEVPTL